jgi:hypothetical protein
MGSSLIHELLAEVEAIRVCDTKLGGPNYRVTGTQIFFPRFPIKLMRWHGKLVLCIGKANRLPISLYLNLLIAYKA